MLLPSLHLAQTNEAGEEADGGPLYPYYNYSVLNFSHNGGALDHHKLGRFPGQPVMNPRYTYDHQMQVRVGTDSTVVRQLLFCSHPEVIHVKGASRRAPLILVWMQRPRTPVVLGWSERMEEGSRSSTYRLNVSLSSTMQWFATSTTPATTGGWRRLMTNQQPRNNSSDIRPPLHPMGVFVASLSGQ